MSSGPALADSDKETAFFSSLSPQVSLPQKCAKLASRHSLNQAASSGEDVGCYFSRKISGMRDRVKLDQRTASSCPRVA